MPSWTIQGHDAWAVIRRKAAPTAGAGRGHAAARSRSLARRTARGGAAGAGRRSDRLVAVPFRQVAERGFEAHRRRDAADRSSTIEAELEVPVDDLLAALPDDADRASPTAAASRPTTTPYGKVVEQIIRDEIGNGEGANLVIGRHYRAVVADWDAGPGADRLPAAARARARRLLDLLLLHRRALPDRRQPGAARQRRTAATSG